MGRRVDFLEPRDAHPRVDLRRLQFGVSQNLLERSNVCPTFQHERGCRIPEQVTASFLTNPSLADIPLNHVGEPHEAECLALRR
mgnify:CR=1 FL=1